MSAISPGKLRREYDFFLSMPRDMRTLLITNIIYALVLPVIDLFVGAYIMRSSNEPRLVAIYQLTVYTGIPITFLINRSSLQFWYATQRIVDGFYDDH